MKSILYLTRKATLQDQRIIFHFLEPQYSHKFHKLFRIFLHWRFVSSLSFIYFFRHLFMLSGLTDFFLNFGLYQLSFYVFQLLKLFQLWALGAFSGGSYVFLTSLTYHHNCGCGGVSVCVCLRTSLFSGTTKMFQVYLVYFLLQS